MMLSNVVREITPLTPHDCFTIFSREKKGFDFPLHYHEEIELNLILGAGGAKRVVGNHISEIGDFELVFIGSNLSHGWFTHNCQSEQIKEVTIQFHKDLIDEPLLKKNQLINLRQIFDYSKRGVLFSQDTAKLIAGRILSLSKQKGFNSILELLSILNELSVSDGIKTLSDSTFTQEQYDFNSRRIEKVFDFMNNHFAKPITLADIAEVASMPESSFSRFIKKRTGYSFVDTLNEIRLGHVCRLLIDTTQSIAEIAYLCGFNNIANFNRTFKTKKGCTPKEFRENFTGKRIFI